MKYLQLPDNKTRILPFYLAMEEYAARIVTPGNDLFFMWQVNPTVIFGRNQHVLREVNIDYCREHGIEVYRRKSGGGCVYADMSNVMFSYITCSDNVALTYSRYTGAVVGMLRQLGINASDNSRNDILIDGLKVSGNAFYHLPGRSIVHGTMLYDTDMRHMLHAITPSRHKLQAKGVDSVRSHITTLNRHIGLSLPQFMAHARQCLCSGTIELTLADVAQIKALSMPYLDRDFIFGNNPAGTHTFTVRDNQVGTIDISITLRHGTIHNINFAGDFFLIGDLDSELVNRLKGVQCSANQLAHALHDVRCQDIILNLTNEKLIKFITDNIHYERTT